MNFSLNCPLYEFDYIPESMSVRNQGASLASGHIPYMLSLLCEWPTAIPLSTMWVTLILPQNSDYLLNSIANIGRLEVRGSNSTGESWNVFQGLNEVYTPQTQQVIGCSFALGVELPGESMEIGWAGVPEHSRGFLNGPIGSVRQNNTPLTISFLETNSSFVDMFVRPWMMLTTHKGFFAYPQEQSIKSTVHVFQLAKAGVYNAPIVRKRYSFFDVVPIAIPGEAVTRSESSNEDSRACQFAYNYYTMSDGSDVS